MRSLPATIALVVVLGAAGVLTGSLLRPGAHAAPKPGASTSAAGIRAVGAAWEQVARSRSPDLHLQSVSCRPLPGGAAWPLRCVGLLSRQADRAPGLGLPWIEVRLRPGPAVEGCKVVGADALPKADCAAVAAKVL